MLEEAEKKRKEEKEIRAGLENKAKVAVEMRVEAEKKKQEAEKNKVRAEEKLTEAEKKLTEAEMKRDEAEKKREETENELEQEVYKVKCQAELFSQIHDDYNKNTNNNDKAYGSRKGTTKEAVEQNISTNGGRDNHREVVSNNIGRAFKEAADSRKAIRGRGRVAQALQKMESSRGRGNYYKGREEE